MSVSRIDNTSDNNEIRKLRKFHTLYIKSFKDLCMWYDKKTGINEQIINLAEYIKYETSFARFLLELQFMTNNLGKVIYYTDNELVITSIAVVDEDKINNCSIVIKYLCGNQSTKDELINGKKQGINMLDFIFDTYGEHSVIRIEPATEGLITYYTSYKKPIFPYDKLGLEETSHYLIYGNLMLLKEECFKYIFRSIQSIDSLMKKLKFESIDDLYLHTNDVASLKHKLITKLEFLIRTKEIDPYFYEQILDKILSIQYYNIDEILMKSREFITSMRSNNMRTSSIVSLAQTGGKNKKSKSKKSKSKKSKKSKSKSKSKKSKKSKK